VASATGVSVKAAPAAKIAARRDVVDMDKDTPWE
jgi:hypothetical protein